MIYEFVRPWSALSSISITVTSFSSVGQSWSKVESRHFIFVFHLPPNVGVWTWCMDVSVTCSTVQQFNTCNDNTTAAII